MTQSSSSSPSTRPANEPKQGSSLDDLGKRFSEATGDQDFARELAENWQKLVGTLVLVLLGVWLFTEFRSAAEQKRGAAAELFTQAQESFEQIVTPKPEGEAEPEAGADLAIRQAMEDKLTQLTKNDADAIYQRLAPLYLAQAAVQQGNLEIARGHLKPYGVESPKGIPAGESVLERDQFVGELAALVYARLLLLDESTARADDVEYIKALAQRARFVNAEALLLLYRTAQSEAEREEAKKLALEIITARPELSEAVRGEFANLGAALS